MNCYTHWRDRELMREPPWWNDRNEDEYREEDEDEKEETL